MRYVILLISICALLAIASPVRADVSMSYGGTVYYVSAARGSDTEQDHDGLSWDKAKATIQGATEQIEDDECNPAQIWVSAETPLEEVTYDDYYATSQDPIILGDGVSLFGGFAGRETRRDNRNWREHMAVIHGGVSLSTGMLDGFIIQNSGGNGVTCASGSFGVISRNTITSVSTGIYCSECASPQILNNVIDSFTSYGIHASAAAPSAIINNTIVGPNKAQGSTGLAFSGDCQSCGVPNTEIQNNIITACATGVSTSGYTSYEATLNDLYDNTTDGLSGQLDVDPEFTSEWGYQLGPNSECLDRSGWTWPWNEYDRCCNARAIDISGEGNEGSNYVDIGAFERSEPEVDRGLPETETGINAGTNRTNVRWADPDPNIIYGDNFTLTGTGSWVIDRVRSWVIPSVPGYTSYYLGDYFSEVQLWFGDIQCMSGNLTAGSSVTSDPRIRITPVAYPVTGSPLYLRADGGIDQLWQIEFGNVNLHLPAGPYTFAVRGIPRVDRMWFNAASTNISSGAGGDGHLKRVNLNNGQCVVTTVDPPGWFGNTSGPRSDINVQIYAHQPAVWE